MRYFDGEPDDQVLKQKWVLDLANRADTFVLESIESRIISDYLLVYFETKTG